MISGHGIKGFISVGVIATVALIAVVAFVVRPSSDAPQGNAAAVNAVFDFPITFYQGEDIAGSDVTTFSGLLGDKPMILNYWASNCPSCSAEMPHFEQVWEKHGDRVVFFGMDIGRFAGFGGPEDSKRELRELGITYPAGPIPDMETIRTLEVRALPTTDFITPDGTVHRTWAGLLDEQKLTELVEELLAASNANSSQGG